MTKKLLLFSQDDLNGFCRFWFRRRFNPAHGDPRAHDQRLGVCRIHAESLENAGLPDPLAILGLKPAPQIIRHQASEVFDRLHIALPERDGYRQSDAFNRQQAVLNAKRLALGVQFGSFAFQEITRASLNFFGGILVKAFNCRDF